LVEKEIEKKETYDLRKSKEEVGPLYPVLVDAEGRFIDGYHRMRVDSNWPIIRLDHIKTRTQLLMARLIANVHRRDVEAEEKTKLVSELAEVTGWTPEEIADRLGMSYTWIMKYLPDKYKSEIRAEAGKLGGETKAKRFATRCVAKLPKQPSAKSSPSDAQPETQEKTGEKTDVSESHRPIEPEIELVYDPNIDDREKYIDGLNMWFLSPGSPVLMALTNYCYDKKIHWTDVVEKMLAKALEEDGYLQDE